jgi:hypothetical protein
MALEKRLHGLIEPDDVERGRSLAAHGMRRDVDCSQVTCARERESVFHFGDFDDGHAGKELDISD